ncbi:MAG: ABC transporter permease [Gemmatimonadetes bacterium]|nr:ABC transporter permease [Gemmatimonadota bacterium]
MASRPVAAWVAQASTTNFIKSQSLIPTRVAETLRAVRGVAEATPLLRLILQLEIGARRVSTIAVGFDSRSLAGRPRVVEGSDRLEPGGIILDQVLARRLSLGVGDSLRSQGRTFRVTGLSRGTNLLLTQLVFITLDDAGELAGFPGITSFFLVRGDSGVDGSTLVKRLRDGCPT